MAVSLYMKKIYEEVGSKSDAEPEGKLTIEKNLHLLRDEVAFLIEEVLEEHPLPYQLNDFQKLVLHQIGSLNNVILVSPARSGKMVVIYLAIFVVQKVLGVSDGVGIGCQPLLSKMNEKVGSKYIKSGTISMQGGLRTAEYEEVESQLELSSAKEEFMNGVLDNIICHAESWLSDVAKSILDSLQQKGKIVFGLVALNPLLVKLV